MTTTERPKVRVKKARAEKAAKPKKRSADRVSSGGGAAVSRSREADGGLDTRARSSLATRPAKTKAKRDGLVLGPEPRVDLMPQSIRLQRKRSKTTRRLGLALIGVVLITGAGIAGSTYVDFTAQLNLAEEQLHTQSILQQQAKYMPVRKVQDKVGLVQAAQQVGASTEIDWKTYLTKVQNTLPAGVQMTTVKIDSASPLAAYAQASAPLQGSRVATLSFAATTKTLPQVPTWLNALATLPGYADGAPGTVTRNDDGTYVANVTLHINEAAFDKRFEPRKGK